MSIYNDLFREIELPHFRKVYQEIDSQKLLDVSSSVRVVLRDTNVLKRIKTGDKVALTAGSREIKNLALIMRMLCDAIKKRGAHPFIIPAMGSHGGAVAENQTALVAHFGMTEESMGVPIKSSMEVVKLGETATGVPVYFDKNASAADAIIPVGRIKIHTCFRGEIESGLLKMLAVGCGKQKDAEAMHRRGFASMSKNVIEVARVIMQELPVVFGLGILENAHGETREIYTIPAENMEIEEKKILEDAKKTSPVLPFDKIDVLVVQTLGKNISGTGMDPNITGRSSPMRVFKPHAERIVALTLSDESDGNAYELETRM